MLNSPQGVASAAVCSVGASVVSSPLPKRTVMKFSDVVCSMPRARPLSAASLGMLQMLKGGARMFDLQAFADLLHDHIEDAHKMANAIETAGFPARADRMRNCCTYTKGVYCPTCHTFHTTAGSLCRDRLCPNCGWSLSRKRALAVTEAVEMLSRHMQIVPLHIMLTVKHDEQSDLSDSINQLIQGLHSLLRYSCIKKHMLAGNLCGRQNNTHVFSEKTP